MVGKILAIRELENVSRRNSTYVDPECDKFFDMPTFIYASRSELTTTCNGCFQIFEGNNGLYSLNAKISHIRPRTSVSLIYC